MVKKALFSLIVIGFIGGVIGLYMFNKPIKSTTNLKTDYSIDAEVLLNVFEEDENSANIKYLDKVIEVKGQVQKVEESDGKITVYLNTENLMSNIIFQLEDINEVINEGEEITLKGICTGYLMDVVFVRGVRV